MGLYEITIPKIGEGEHEVRLIGLLKQVGEWVEQDEPLYEVETSKADMVMEAPAAGRVLEWLAGVGDDVAIGAVIGRLDCGAETNGAVRDGEVGTARVVPPRTRAHARRLGLTDADLAAVPAAGKHLLPEDVDAYLAAREAPAAGLRELDARQQQFIAQLRQTLSTAIPATLRHILPWDAVRRVASRRELHVPAFHVLAYCVTRTVAQHPLFRSRMIDDRRVEESEHVNLGVGVDVPPDRLATAVMAEADRFGPNEFARRLRELVRSVQRGLPGRGAAAHTLLSFMPRQGVLDGTPVLVSPAVATIFVGQPHDSGGSWQAHVTMTFDHRLINGAPAARFLRCLADEVAAADEHPWG